MFNRKKYKEFALIQLQNRRKIPLLMTLIIMVVSFVFSLPQSISTANAMEKWLTTIDDADLESLMDMLTYFSSLMPPRSAFINLIAGIIESFMGAILSVSALHVYLQMSRSPEPVKFSLFMEGFNDWGRAICGYLWRTLWLFLWALAGLGIYLVVALIVSLISVGITAATESSAVLVVLLPVFILIAIIGLYAPIIIKLIQYSQQYYLIAEFKNLSVVKALEISKKITKGHLWDIALTYLSFLGWFILSAITYHILNLWLTPYVQMTFINVYHGLLKEALEKGTITAEELKGVIPETTTTDSESPKPEEVFELPSVSTAETEKKEENTEKNDSEEQKND